MIDAFLETNICYVEDCGEDATRHCPLCFEWRCSEHPCKHMGTEAKSWLSAEAVIGRMTDEELASARLRLSLQLNLIDAEVHARQLGKLQDQRFEAWKTKTVEGYQRKKRKKQLSEILDSLTPELLAKLERKLRGE